MSLYEVESILLNILIAGSTPERMEQALRLSIHLIQKEMGHRITLDCNGQKLHVSKSVAERLGFKDGDFINDIQAEALMDADGTQHELINNPTFDQ